MRTGDGEHGPITGLNGRIGGLPLRAVGMCQGTDLGYLARMADEGLTLEARNRATLARQMLLGREKVGVVEAVERLGGLQAQEPKPPFVALWNRVDGFERAQLADALHAGDVVRAMSMRATLH